MVELKLALPESFLEEEVRCGYTVSKKMKEIWAVQLDLFAEFDRVCKKYNITYIASGGTMLGAVRHHGFIPWDDDMDLMMTRDQYVKLCSVASEEFSHPYFFQTEKTDVGFVRGFARLRNSNTTGIQKEELSYKLPYNQGIFIDIFPMDNVPDDIADYKRQVKEFLRKKQLCTYFNLIEQNIVNNNVSFVERLFRRFLSATIGSVSRHLGIANRYYEEAQKTCTRYNNRTTEYISLASFQIDNLKHTIRATDMENIILIDFEFLQMPVIANYDEHLKRKYGDYTIPIRENNYHGTMLFDVNVPYRNYLNK